MHLFTNECFSSPSNGCNVLEAGYGLRLSFKQPTNNISCVRARGPYDILLCSNCNCSPLFRHETVLIPAQPSSQTFCFNILGASSNCTARMNKSCCFVLQYNTEALVLVLQYYFGKRAILKQYQNNLSDRSGRTAHAGISDRVTKEIEIRIVLN